MYNEQDNDPVKFIPRYSLDESRDQVGSLEKSDRGLTRIKTQSRAKSL